MFQAKDIMNPQVITVGPNDTVDEVLGLMLLHRITGLFVVDQEDRILGVLSDFDLLDMVYDCHVEENQVSHYMSTDIVEVDKEASWIEVADLLRAKRIRRLPVTHKGRVVGIISRHDLMRTIHSLRQQTRLKLSQTVSMEV